MPPLPLTSADFARRLVPLLPADCGTLAVAVSGGPDSMALLLLADAFAHEAGLVLQALTVDHRLRAESAGEARQVARWCRARGIAHRTLVWRGERPKSNIQAAARAARYGLMLDWCRRHGAAALLLAHHLEDQAETVLLRLGRGSGVDGLAGMRPVFRLDGIALVRPLLEVPKARLRATLEAAGQGWIDDPSNRNAAFQRVRVREALDLLAPEGVAPVHVASTAARMRRVEAALAQTAADLADRALPLRPLGWCPVESALLAAAPAEIALRALRRRLCEIGGDPVPPRLDRLEHFLARTIAGVPGSLHRCRLMLWRGSPVLVREARHLPPPHPSRPGLMWDGRFAVPARRGLVVAALGAEGLRQVRESGAELPAIAPRAALLTLPGLWRGGTLVAAPTLGFARKTGAGRAFRAE